MKDEMLLKEAITTNGYSDKQEADCELSKKETAITNNNYRKLEVGLSIREMALKNRKKDEMPLQDAILTSLVKYGPVKNYVIIDKSKTPRKFGVFTKYGKFNQTATSYEFCTCAYPWEDQTFWEEPKVCNLDGSPIFWEEPKVCNLDGSPIFCGYFFVDFKEFSNDSEASLARLLNEKTKDQLKPDT